MDMEQHRLSPLHSNSIFHGCAAGGAVEWPLRYKNTRTKPSLSLKTFPDQKGKRVPHQKSLEVPDPLSCSWSGFHTCTWRLFAVSRFGFETGNEIESKRFAQEAQRALQKKSKGNVCGTLSKKPLRFYSAPLLSLVQTLGLEPPKITPNSLWAWKRFWLNEKSLEMHREPSAQFPDINRAAQSHSEYRKCFLICKWGLTLFHRRNYNSWKLANVSRSLLKARLKKKKKKAAHLMFLDKNDINWKFDSIP